MFFGWPSKMRAQRKQLFFAGKDLALVCFGQVSEVQHCWRLQDPSKIHSTQQSARPCLQPEPPLRLARIRDFDGCNNSGGKSCALTFLGKMQPVESSGICSLSSLSLFFSSIPCPFIRLLLSLLPFASRSTAPRQLYSAYHSAQLAGDPQLA